jgi:hypothetical protein
MREKTAFSNVRSNELETDDANTRCWYFFNNLVPCVAGKKCWTAEEMILKKITESGCVSVLDEAFTILCIENYWEKWMNNGKPEWTGDRRNNPGLQGWAKGGYERFASLCKSIREQRGEPHSDNLEEAFKQRAIAAYATGGRPRQSLGVPAVENYDELAEA